MQSWWLPVLWSCLPFLDSLLAAQHSVYLTESLLFMSKHMSNKKGSSTEENERSGSHPEQTQEAAFLSTFLETVWRHREILGVSGGGVWPHPSGSVLGSFSTL